MNTRKHDVEKQRYWQRTIGDAARSGMSIREFCRQRRFNYKRFRELTDEWVDLGWNSSNRSRSKTNSTMEIDPQEEGERSAWTVVSANLLLKLVAIKGGGTGVGC
jgi:hypothetical protein